MAVVTVKSAEITNRDAVPRVPSQGRIARSRMKRASGIVAITSGDSVGSKYLACQVPSNAVITSVKLSSPDIGTTTAADVGIYETTKNGGAVVDADHFASAVALNAGALNKSEVVNESGVYAVASMEKALWDALGKAADTHRDYDVALTLTGAADGTGSVLVEVEYTE